jgi:hypothetical protein
MRRSSRTALTETTLGAAVALILMVAVMVTILTAGRSGAQMQPDKVEWLGHYLPTGEPNPDACDERPAWSKTGPRCGTGESLMYLDREFCCAPSQQVEVGLRSDGVVVWR